MSTADRPQQLLNGWWDFMPVAHPDLSTPLNPDQVPGTGWQREAYLVPGLFTDHAYPEAWRSGGYLAPGFQVSWTHQVNNRSGWMRTAFTTRPRPGYRAYLTLGGAIPQAHIFVNNHKVGVQDDMFIGDPIDVTAVLRDGKNELAVFLTEFKTYPHPSNKDFNLIDVPWGCCTSTEQAGIWQDVELEWRPEVHIEEVIIRTSVRANTLTIITRVANLGGAAFQGVLNHSVESAGQEVFHLQPLEFNVAAGKSRELTQTAPWSNYRPWSPHDPHLYHLRSEVGEDSITTRFGFREVWIEGHRILLNGVPQRWMGEWGHKAHSHCLRPEYVKQWFRQLKSLNCNYARLHTYPHPGFILDIADEMGIVVAQESALHGSHQAGYESPQLWERAHAHVARMVRRDRNHASLVLWSVENEMRWALNVVPGAKQELPELRALFNQLDPTRPAYHDGDSSLWDEGRQPIISRHYGAACTGLGWWTKQTPLHAGEVGSWHFASPYVALEWATDEVFADYQALSVSLARECARVVELGRANEVSCLFIWNTSGLDNFRPAAEKSFDWPEPNSRYAKPLKHIPYESEFAWWDPASTGYRPGWSFDIMRQACRPLAVVIREERAQAYTDRELPHTVMVINDLPSAAMGELQMSLEQGGSVLWRSSCPLAVASGETGTVSLNVPLGGARDGKAVVVTMYRCQLGEDTVCRSLSVVSASVQEDPLQLPPVAIWGKSSLTGWLAGHGVKVTSVDGSGVLDPSVTPLLVIGEQSVIPGSDQNRILRQFVMQGGRALVLEQTYSIFPGVTTRAFSSETAQVRDPFHPVMAGMTNADLCHFGDDPYGLTSSDSVVTRFPFEKPKDGKHLIHVLVDCSRGGFGSGGLNAATLIEAPLGKGTVIASQFRLEDRLGVLPVADRLFRNILNYLAAFNVDAPVGVDVEGTLVASLRAALPGVAVQEGFADGKVMIVSGETARLEAPAAIRRRLAGGVTVMVCNVSDEAAGYWSQVIGVPITRFVPDHAVYQLVRGMESPLLAGLSHEDSCWLANWVYCWEPGSKKDVIADSLLHIPGGRTLLQNASRSGLDRLYGDEQATEWKRMPVLSKFFDGPSPRVGGGLVEVPVGKGRVIFWQINWRPDLWRFHRILGTVLSNLGVATGSDVLAGECVVASGKASDGYPVRMRTVRAAEAGVLEEVLAFSKRHTESYSGNALFHGWPHWTVVDAPGGQVAACQVPGKGPVVIGLDIGSPGPRRIMETIGGLPNPDLQTFLRLRGSGRVRAWINTKLWADLVVESGQTAYVPDIDFEAGSNFVVLEWTPASGEASLALLFENKNRMPELTFSFW